MSTANTTTISLETQAITAAKAGDWSTAISANEQILAQHPHDINALNRLGFAYLQLRKLDSAAKTFAQVLTIEKSNPIAQKQLLNIKRRHVTPPQFNAESFVEEPSKSKIISLHRLTSKQVLEKLVVGQELTLKLKNRFISVVTLDQVYLGSLPEDISLRLSFLISRGNRYSCGLHSASSKHCTVFIKETYQATSNRHYHSFVSNYTPGKDDTIGDELLLLADETPIGIVDEDTESADPDKK
jgi:tetratricopeptide (TPR) repeat protein